MKCSSAQKRLSAYYDGEFAENQSGTVTRHLLACPACRSELDGYSALSRLAGELPNPMPPDSLWASLLAKLANVNHTEASDSSRRARRTLVRQLAIAATLLILLAGVIGIGFTTGRNVLSPHPALVAKNFQRYLDEFQINPTQAHQVLLTNYHGKRVDAADTFNELGYRPAVAERLPEGYSLSSAYILRMPCCICIQVVFERDDHSVLVIFEHEQEEPEWFHDRPTITVRCNERPTKVIQIGNQLAASWKTERRHLTVIGLRDTTELTKLRTYWSTGGRNAMNTSPA